MPEEETTEDIQIAVGIDKIADSEKGALKVWNGTWLDTGLTFDPNQWIRVSLTMDYNASPKTCKLLVDGQPAAIGGNASVSLGGAHTKVKSVKVVGSTSIDDMVVKATTAETTVTPQVTTKDADGNTDMSVSGNYVTADNEIKVDKQWLSDNGVVWTTKAVSAAPAENALTVAQQYAAGFDKPAAGNVLKIKDMAMTKEGATVKVTLTLPVGEGGNGYRNVVSYSNDGVAFTDGAVVDNSKSVTLEFPAEANVRYFRVQTKDGGAAE